MSGRKMAKSAGNFQRVTELVDRGIDPLAFRYLALTSRYGHKLEYSDASIEAAAAALASLRARLRGAGPAARRRAVGRSDAHPGGRCGRPARGRRRRAWLGTAAATRRRRRQRRRPGACTGRSPLRGGTRRSTSGSSTPIDDDLDMPAALAVVREILRSELPADERRWLVLDADAVLGLDLHRGLGRARGRRRDGPGRRSLPSLAARGAARAARDFARADALRAEIEALGWEVTDGPDGSTVTRRG